MFGGAVCATAFISRNTLICAFRSQKEGTQFAQGGNSDSKQTAQRRNQGQTNSFSLRSVLSLKGHKKWGRSLALGENKCPQERPKESSREIQASQLHFGPWENHGPSHTGAHFWAHEGEKGDWKPKMYLSRANHTWPSWLASLTPRTDLWKRAERQMSFTSTLERSLTVSPTIFLYLSGGKPDGWKNSLEKRMMVNGSYSAWRPVKILWLAGKVKASYSWWKHGMIT